MTTAEAIRDNLAFYRERIPALQESLAATRERLQRDPTNQDALWLQRVITELLDNALRRLPEVERELQDALGKGGI